MNTTTSNLRPLCIIQRSSTFYLQETPSSASFVCSRAKIYVQIKSAEAQELARASSTSSLIATIWSW